MKQKLHPKMAFMNKEIEKLRKNSGVKEVLEGRTVYNLSFRDAQKKASKKYDERNSNVPNLGNVSAYDMLKSRNKKVLDKSGLKEFIDSLMSKTGTAKICSSLKKTFDSLASGETIKLDFKPETLKGFKSSKPVAKKKEASKPKKKSI